MKLAPVCVFTYNRLSTLRKTIEALSNNKLIDDTEVYIFNDGPKTEYDKIKVDQVRNYLSGSLPLKNYKLIYREKNWGLSKSIINGVSEIIEKHEKIIVIEDDIVTSNESLKFFNQSLEFYSTSKKVFSISGFSYPLERISKNEYDNYFSMRAYPWGWATWKDQWESVIWEKEYLKNKISKLNSSQLYKGGRDLITVLNFHFKGKVDSWDTVWTMNQIIQNKLTVMPWKSQTQNIGFGTDSTHCIGFDFHKTTLDIASYDKFRFDPACQENINVTKAIKYKYSYLNKIIIRLKSLRKKSDFIFLLKESQIVIKRYLK